MKSGEELSKTGRRQKDVLIAKKGLELLGKIAICEE
jgi:hypothetical protein